MQRAGSKEGCFFFFIFFSKMSKKIYVPNDSHGKLIGRGGSVIKQIQGDSGAKVSGTNKLKVVVLLKCGTCFHRPGEFAWSCFEK